MNSITKIGRMALERILSCKLAICNEKTIVTRVDFSKNPIDLSAVEVRYYLNKLSDHQFYRMWSIELGMIPFVLKENQTLYYSILRRLKKLQKEDVPSHLIFSENITKDKTETIRHIVYRLTDEQELMMYYEGLWPSITKRWNALQERATKEHEVYLAYMSQFEEQD